MRRAALALLLLACARKPARPMLSVFDDSSSPAATAIDPRGVALALGVMRPAARAALRERLTATADDELKRANPLIVDLEGTQTTSRTELAASLRSAVPSVTAALNLLGSPWRAPGIRVELGDACAPAAKQCVPLFDAGLARDAAFASWAWSNAMVIHSSDPDALRARAEQPGSTIALVISASSGRLDPGELAALKHQAERALPHLEEKSAARHWLEALRDAPAGWAQPLPLGDGEVLVVPRLSALAKLDEFRDEVSRR